MMLNISDLDQYSKQSQTVVTFEPWTQNLEPIRLGGYKKSLYGLAFTKPLRQFHDLQRNIHRLLATTFILIIEAK